MDDSQELLHELLRELADIRSDINKDGNSKERERELLAGYARRMHDIYGDGFRHRYSELFGVLVQFEDSRYRYKKKCLIDNVRKICDYIADNPEPEFDETTISKIRKLDDHLSLDSARIDYTKQISKDLNNKNGNLLAQIGKLNKKAEGMQREYVAILGIFASIIVTFMAGMVFSSSVLSNIDKVSIYRLVFVIAALAAVLVNMLYVLLRFLQKVHFGDTDSAWGGTCGDIVSDINVFLLLAVLIDVILWAVYWYRATGFSHFAGY